MGEQQEKEEVLSSNALPQEKSALAILTCNFFASLRIFNMEMESTWNPNDPVGPRDNSNKFYRPPPIILTSPVSVISFQEIVKYFAQDHISLRTTGPGILILSNCLTDYRLILFYLSDHNFHHFTFYPQSDKPINAVILHLPIRTSSQDIPLAFQELEYIISARQMTTKRPPPTHDVSVTTISLPHIPSDSGTLSEVTAVEESEAQTRLMPCYNYQRFGHIWTHSKQLPLCVWCGGGHRPQEWPEKNNGASVSKCRYYWGYICVKEFLQGNPTPQL